ncbi:hypothetical protein ACQKQC_26635 [Vibrio fortis]|uniref:hypothetical protein n=1 Tax=Vibrio fortis TaxID=212667 RepID=UPI0040677780
MSRDVTLTVENNTGIALIYVKKNDKHGKFTKNPPKKIEATGSWKCSSRSGGAYGPEGYVLYQFEGQDTTVKFKFDHPIAATKSKYGIELNPLCADFDYEEDHSGGHTQKVFYKLYKKGE